MGKNGNHHKRRAMDTSLCSTAEGKFRVGGGSLPALFSKAHMGILIVDQKHRIVQVNEHFAHMVGYSRGELLNLYTWQLDALLSEKEIRREFENIYRTNRQFETRHRHKDGTLIDMEISATGTIINGKSALFCICQDITARKKAERALQESEAKFRSFIENANDIMFILDFTGVITYISPNILKLSALKKEEIEGKCFSTLVHPGDVGRLKGLLYENFCKRKQCEEVECRCKHGDGCYHWYSIKGSMGADEDQNPIMFCIARNITEKKRHEEQLRYLSLHDQLTGLYNRYYFEVELERLAKSREYPISFLYCDLDGLKAINDSKGHQAGDLLLKNCANILENSFRNGDIIARVGGDEFAVILLKTDAETAAAAVRRIYSNVDLFNKNRQDLRMSIAIGRATAASSNQGLHRVFAEADEDMYRTKKGLKKSTANVFFQRKANGIDVFEIGK